MNLTLHFEFGKDLLMRMMLAVGGLGLLLFLGGCTRLSLHRDGEVISTGYHPIDPLEFRDGTLGTNWSEYLPDETTRLVVGQTTVDGSVRYGPGVFKAENKSYSVVVDYIKYTTKSAIVGFRRPVENFGGSGVKRSATSVLQGHSFGDLVRIHHALDEAGKEFDPPEAVFLGFSSDISEEIGSAGTNYLFLKHVPVYIAVGLRLQANLRVLSGEVQLTDLFSIGLAARNGNVTGSMVTQTLGLTGREISSLTPLPAAINETSIQNAVTSIATIKSKLYDEGTVRLPRIVGFYNPGLTPRQISQFVSGLAASPSMGSQKATRQSE